MWTRRDVLSAGGAALATVIARGARSAEGERGRVVGYPESAEAGGRILAAGGNAVDAIVAAAFVATVVSPSNTGLGGYGGHAVISTPDGRVTAIDFNSMAPAAARADMFPLDEKGAVRGNIERYGWLAAGVPGVPGGLDLVYRKFGTRPFAELLQPAIRYAREGFQWDAGEVRTIGLSAARLAQNPVTARLFVPGGAPPKAGDTHRNPEVAELLETFARRGSTDSFYRGDIAQRIADDFQKHGGIVTAADLAAYHAREVKPLELSWNGYSVRTAPLTAGSATGLQALHTLKALGWGHGGPSDPASRHAQVEAFRIAWNDRLKHFGDPEHAHVPLARLLSSAYAEQSAERVRAAVRDRKPVTAETDGRTVKETVHLSAVDGNGMMAALTLTHGGSFGSQVAVEGLGLVLGHGMSRFDPHPDHPNAPGPHKRPLHNMCPTIVLKDGRPVVAIGGAGGRQIPNAVFETVAEYVGRGASLEQAVANPRFHTEGDLNLVVDAGVPESEIAYLRGIGYAVTQRGPIAVVSAVAR